MYSSSPIKLLQKRFSYLVFRMFKTLFHCEIHREPIFLWIFFGQRPLTSTLVCFQLCTAFQRLQAVPTVRYKLDMLVIRENYKLNDKQPSFSFFFFNFSHHRCCVCYFLHISCKTYSLMSTLFMVILFTLRIFSKSRWKKYFLIFLFIEYVWPGICTRALWKIYTWSLLQRSKTF